MKIYDIVRVKANKDYLVKQGIYAGREGKIIEPEIVRGAFRVFFIDTTCKEPDIFADVLIEDLDLLEAGFASDEIILEELQARSSEKWCKVENGYIVNLLGEKKNKKAYRYDS